MWTFIQPMLNVLIALSDILFHNFGLAIIALTIIVRAAILPLTLKQLRASRTMSQLSPKMQELQQKYAQDRARLAQETQKLYKEAGMSPAGCLLPMLIQLPVWIALYQSIIKSLTATPRALMELSNHLYSWSIVHQAVPLGEKFLWLNLGQPDGYYILPILVGGSMWVQQKMATVPTTNPQQQQQNTMMLWMMPIMFGFLTATFPSGLALYWLISNIISIVIQYFVTGWGTLKDIGKSKEKAKKKRRPAAVTPVPEPEELPAPAQIATEGLRGERLRDKSSDRRTSYRTRPRTARSRPRRGKDHRRSRR